MPLGFKANKAETTHPPLAAGGPELGAARAVWAPSPLLRDHPGQTRSWAPRLSAWLPVSPETLSAALFAAAGPLGQAGCGGRRPGQGRRGAQVESSGSLESGQPGPGPHPNPCAARPTLPRSQTLKHYGPSLVLRREKWSDGRHFLAALVTLARKTERFRSWKPPVSAGRGPLRGAAKTHSNSRIAILAFSKMMLFLKKKL